MKFCWQKLGFPVRRVLMCDAIDPSWQALY
jgi:hypothetical protein